jgi:hypothetical protein
VLGQIANLVGADADAPGGSTLATQIEKYRHSPDGVTYDAGEKLRQMISASTRAYLDGEETAAGPPAHPARLPEHRAAVRGGRLRRGQRPGRRVWVWFAADFERSTRCSPPPTARARRWPRRAGR